MNTAQIQKTRKEVCRLKHFSLSSEKSYGGWIQSYIKVVKRMPREWSSEQKAEKFLTDLDLGNVAAATQN